ncbi:S1 family peptidase [Sorangium sp. So ce1000]|uniref:S1 family peptidase n=1 Tax=Sorangium sp. So ce1000 TaxID=3133325 RepID=UPI003F633E10
MKARSFSIALFLLLIAACQSAEPNPTNPPPEPPASPTPPPPPAEPWASRPPREWPQLVLTNRAEFQGSTPLQGASAFLVKTQDGRTLAATAKHLLGSNGGVKPAVSVAAFDGAIQSWRLFPRTLPHQLAEAGKVGADGLDDPRLDWLILTLKDTGNPLPATPMRLRQTPVDVGEVVYLVGCPYDEVACKQNVYVGKITARSGHRFRCDIDPPVDLHGFSGAPVVDRAGHVVGVMTVGFEARMQGEKFLEAGGEDAASIYRSVERQR